MSDNNAKPFNCITVLCDPRRIQRIALTCRCGHRWLEIVPQELHDSDMTAQFECSQCSTLYHLRNHQLSRVDKNSLQQQEETNVAGQEFARIKHTYDA